MTYSSSFIQNAYPTNAEEAIDGDEDFSDFSADDQNAYFIVEKKDFYEAWMMPYGTSQTRSPKFLMERVVFPPTVSGSHTAIPLSPCLLPELPALHSCL